MIARNKIGDRVRILRRSVVTQEFPMELLAEEEPKAEFRAASHDLLHRALKSLRGEFDFRIWTAFEQTALQSRAVRDVAEELGMSSQAVRQARYRALNRLRTLMRDERLA